MSRTCEQFLFVDIVDNGLRAEMLSVSRRTAPDGYALHKRGRRRETLHGSAQNSRHDDCDEFSAHLPRAAACHLPQRYASRPKGLRGGG